MLTPGLSLVIVRLQAALTRRLFVLFLKTGGVASEMTVL